MEKKQIDYAQLHKDRVISIWDLFLEIVRKLWFVILLAVIGAALLGGYKYVKDTQTANMSASQPELSVLEDNFSEEEAAEIDNALKLQEDLQQQQEYLDRSVLMQINAYDESCVDLQYRITGVQNGSRDLLEAYKSYINNGALASDLQINGMDLDIQYLNELISYEDSGGSFSRTEDEILVSTLSNMFDVRVIHTDRENCEELANKVTECMNSYQEYLNGKMGAHGLELVNQSYSKNVDRDLWNYKKDRVNNLVSAQDNLDTFKEDMNDEQKVFLDQYEQQKESQEEVAEKELASVSLSKKHIAAGGLAGIVLALFVIIIWYVIRDTVNSAREIQRIYNISVLGELESVKSRNILYRLTRRFAGKRKEEVSLAESVQLLATKLRMYCRKNGIKEIFLIGKVGTQEYGDWISKVLAELEKSGIRAGTAEDILYSPEMIEKLMEYDHIVLVEWLKHSRYQDAVNEIKLCLEQNVQIEGAIILN